MQTISKDTKENIHIGKINNRAETFNHHKIYASNNISEKIIKLQLKAMETGRSSKAFNKPVSETNRSSWNKTGCVTKDKILLQIMHIYVIHNNCINYINAYMCKICTCMYVFKCTYAHIAHKTINMFALPYEQLHIQQRTHYF